MKTPLQPITIAHRWRDHVAVDPVLVREPFALHRSFGLSGWTVTHIPTGYAVRTCITSKAAALRLLRAAVQQADEHPVLWQSNDVTRICQSRYRVKMRDAAKQAMVR